VYIIIPVYTTVIHDSSSVIYTNILFERLSNLSSQIILSRCILARKVKRKAKQIVFFFSQKIRDKHFLKKVCQTREKISN
jgi:hypothetical protein